MPHKILSAKEIYLDGILPPFSKISITTFSYGIFDHYFLMCICLQNLYLIKFYLLICKRAIFCIWQFMYHIILIQKNVASNLMSIYPNIELYLVSSFAQKKEYLGSIFPDSLTLCFPYSQFLYPKKYN